MQLVPLTILIAAWFGVVPREVEIDPLILHVHETSVRIGARPTAALAMYGPAVTFGVIAQFDCPGDTTAESVAVSIADTLWRGTPADGENSVTATLVVPGDQIVPMETGDFCLGETARSEDELLLPAVATAHVSLRCRDANGSAVRFASVAMPLRLVCEVEENQVESASLDR